MTEKDMSIIAKYTGVKELETLNSGVKNSYHIFTPIMSSDREIKIRYDNPAIVDLVLKLQGKYELNWVEKDNQQKRIFDKQDNIVVVVQEEDNDNNNNDKKAKDCGVCLERITYTLATKCEDWEVKRKKQIEDLKKGKCFHEKGNLPAVLDLKSKTTIKTCPKCRKEYDASKSNDLGDEKTLTHNCSQKPNNQDDPEENDNGDNSNNNKIAEKSTVRKYCRDNDIQKLEYDEETGKLIITYKKPSKPKSELDNLTGELQEIKNYLKKKGERDSKNKRRFLTENDWKEDQQQNQSQNNKTDWTPWIIAGGIGLFIIVLIAVIGLVRKND